MSYGGRLRLVAVCSLVLIAGLGTPGPRATSAEDQGSTEALRFRTEFGLSTDRSYIASLEASTQPSVLFGVPLTASEEKLMVRRSAIPSELAKVREYGSAHAATWGGMWLTYPPDLPAGISLQLNVAVTSDAIAMQSAILALAPADVAVVATRVKHTEGELDAVLDEVSKDAEFFDSLGTTYYSGATMLPENAVEIDVSTVTDAATAAADARYGADTVRLVPAGPVGGDSCTRSQNPPSGNCGPPWRGGLTIYPATNGNYCTSGFVVRKFTTSYVYALWTAGHCQNNTWHQGSQTGTLIGTTSANYFANNSAADVQVIPISAANASNSFIDDGPTCTICHVFNVTAKEGHDADGVGDTVCNHGAISGTKCGTITSTNVNFTYLGVNLVRMRRASYTRNPGDSGGPITSFSGTAEGSHTHYQVISNVQYAIFSQVWEMEQASGFMLLTGDVFAATPIADGKSVQATPGTPITITLSGSHDGGALTYTVRSGPSHGGLDSTSGSMSCDASVPAHCTADVLYTPTIGYHGLDSFTYTVDNVPDGSSPTATVSIIVDNAPVAVDDPGVSCSNGVSGGRYTVYEDTPLTVGSASPCGLLANDTDADSDPLTASKASDPTLGSVSVTSSGGFTYTPTANKNGDDSFTYSASDGILSATATVRVHIIPVDDPPNAVNDTTFVVPENAAATALNVLANDTYLPDAPETLTIVSVTQGSHGSVAITGGGTGLTYKPTTLYYGTDQFTYTVRDSGGALQDTATVALTVAKDTTAPVVRAPAESIYTSRTLGTSTVAIRIAWSATDPGTGVVNYELWRQVDGGAWTAITLATPTTTAISTSLYVGHSYRYRVRVTDFNGNVSALVYGPTFKVYRYQESATAIVYGGTWSTSAYNASNSGGYTRYAYTAGKSATFTATARDFAFAAPTSSTRSSARIYVDGVLVATISEYSSTTLYRRVLWSRHFSTLASHTIRVVVAGNGRIDVDCFLALR